MNVALRIMSGGAMLAGSPLALAQGLNLAAIMLAVCALAVGVLTRDLPQEGT